MNSQPQNLRQVLLFALAAILGCDASVVDEQDPVPEQPSPPGELVFTVKRPGDEVHIYHSRLDNLAAAAPLKTASPAPWNPRFSASGQEVFYSNHVESAGGYRALRVHNLEQGGDTLILGARAGFSAREVYPVMSSLVPSASGEGVYFNEYADFGAPRPMHLRFDTSHYERIPTDPALQLAAEIAPDSLLMFAWLWEAAAFVVVDRAGVELARFRLPPQVGKARINSAQWKQATREIVFDFTSQAYPRWSIGILDAGDGTFSVITPGRGASFRYPRWGPDNTVFYLQNGLAASLNGSAIVSYNPKDSTSLVLLSPDDIGPDVEYLGQFDFFGG